MSTCNFRTMKKFPLVVLGDDDVCKIFVESDNGEYTDADVAYAWDIFNDELEYGYLSEELEELNNKLQWYNVRVRYGYYSGVQFYIDTEYADVDEKAHFGGLVWEDDDCFEYFGVKTRSDLKEMIADEEKIINDFLSEAVKSSWRELICGGVFSNGEAVYYYKDELEKRAKGEG